MGWAGSGDWKGLGEAFVISERKEGRRRVLVIFCCRTNHKCGGLKQHAFITRCFLGSGIWAWSSVSGLFRDCSGVLGRAGVSLRLERGRYTSQLPCLLARFGSLLAMRPRASLSCWLSAGGFPLLLATWASSCSGFFPAKESVNRENPQARRKLRG